MELGGKYLSYKKKHLVRFWMSTEKVARGCWEDLHWSWRNYSKTNGTWWKIFKSQKKTFSSILDVYREGSKRMLRGPSLILKKLQFWDCCNGYTPLLEVNQALIAWSYRQPRQCSPEQESRWRVQATSGLKMWMTKLDVWPSFVYGHIMLKTPVLVWSLKLSNIEPC